MTSEKYPLTDIERKLVKALQGVTCLPGSYDKRFCLGLPLDALYTEKQKKYLHFCFNKYRRQIKDYERLAFELDPDRFDVKIDFNGDLFDLKATAKVEFKDTFKPTRFVK